MTDSLVSIIVPVYNVESYISECIESIRGQTYKNLQIILVDDGSTDQSGILCDEYAKQDQRIHVIHQQNGGTVIARQKGLQYAEGTYIGFVDGDDCIAPDMYRSLVSEMETSGADFVHTGYWKNDRKRATSRQQIIDFSRNDEKIDFLKTAVLGPERYISPSMWSKLFKAELIIKCFNQISQDNQLGEDLINLCICVLESNKVALTDSTYYYYRVRSDSMFHKNNLGRIKDIIRMYEGVCKALVSHGCYQELKGIMDGFLWDKVLEYVDINGQCFQIEEYYFKDVDVLKGKKIIIYGAGRVGRDYYSQICRYTECQVVAWVDEHPYQYEYQHIRLHEIDSLDSIEFDLLVIAVKSAEMASEIFDQLITRGIEKNRIYWSKPERLLPDIGGEEGV